MHDAMRPFPRTHPLWHYSQRRPPQASAAACAHAHSEGGSAAEGAAVQAEAMVAELRPGDLLYLPPFTWHSVQSLTACVDCPIQKGTRVLISLWDSLMSGRVPDCIAAPRPRAPQEALPKASRKPSPGLIVARGSRLFHRAQTASSRRTRPRRVACPRRRTRRSVSLSTYSRNEAHFDAVETLYRRDYAWDLLRRWAPAPTTLRSARHVLCDLSLLAFAFRLSSFAFRVFAFSF